MKLGRKVSLLFFMMMLCTICDTGFAQGFVYHVRINTEIDLGVAPYIRRVVDDAEKKGASAIIFEVNTFGGRVDAATQIKDAIIHSPVRTVAYINDRAVSAGALISLSCEKIVMHAGSVIGASTVVDGEGKKQSEKYQAYMRSEMRSTAERYGRRKDIAEGMVDEKVQVEQLNPDGNKLISLTALEAKNFGICDTILNNEQQILSYIGIPNAQVIVLESNWAEKFVGFLNQPFVSSILIIIGLIGIFTELKSPGLGFPVVAGIIAFSLFFGSSYILQLASVWEIVAFILGLALLALEIFVIPGFGVTGIAGIGLMIGSIFFSLFSTGPDMATSIQYAIVQLAISLLVTVVLVSLLIRFLPKSDRFKKLTLQTANASGAGFVASSNYGELLGKRGYSITPLRPAGTVVISGEKYDVIADGDFINKDEAVQVISAEGRKIIVSRVRE